MAKMLVISEVGEDDTKHKEAYSILKKALIENDLAKDIETVNHIHISTSKNEEICKLLGKLVHENLVNDEEAELLMDCAIILRKVEPNNKDW